MLINANLGDAIKVEAWLLRDMVYLFSRAAKRGHRPRESEMITLMQAAEIPIPEYRSRTSSSSVGCYGFCLRFSFLFKQDVFGMCHGGIICIMFPWYHQPMCPSSNSGSADPAPVEDSAAEAAAAVNGGDPESEADDGDDPGENPESEPGDDDPVVNPEELSILRNIPIIVFRDIIPQTNRVGACASIDSLSTPILPEGSARSRCCLHRARGIDKQLPCLGWCSRCLGFLSPFPSNRKQHHNLKIWVPIPEQSILYVSKGMVMENFLVKIGSIILSRT